jgi:hypothetical protein
MPTYRLYAIDQQNHILSGDNFQSEGDGAAVEYAGDNLHPGCRAEVWQGARCVGRVPARSTSNADAQYVDVASSA